MGNTFKYLVLALVRDKGMMVWTLAFPIILSTCFIFMFAGLDAQGSMEPVQTIVVEDEAYEEDFAFRTFIEGLSQEDETGEGDDPLLAVTLVPTYEQAQAMLRGNGNSQDEAADDGALLEVTSDNDFVGIVQLGSDGLPRITFKPSTADASAQMEDVYQSILVTVMDTYASRHRLVSELVQDDPGALAEPSVIGALFSANAITQKVSLTHATPTESVRYYFALLGFAAMMGAQTSLIAVLWLLPSTGALGARRAVGGTSRVSSLLGTLTACWAVSFLCLVVAYAFMRFIAGVDFVGRDLACLGALAASSLMATALGAAIAVIPKLGMGAKSGILTAIVCVAALFAGLYGQPTMELADTVAAACPASQWVNPAVQVSQAMFSLMYYDTWGPYLSHIAALLVMAVLLFVCSSAALRRQRYASL